MRASIHRPTGCNYSHSQCRIVDWKSTVESRGRVCQGQKRTNFGQNSRTSRIYKEGQQTFILHNFESWTQFTERSTETIHGHASGLLQGEIRHHASKKNEISLFFWSNKLFSMTLLSSRIFSTCIVVHSRSLILHEFLTEDTANGKERDKSIARPFCSCCILNPPFAIYPSLIPIDLRKHQSKRGHEEKKQSDIESPCLSRKLLGNWPRDHRITSPMDPLRVT